MIHSLPKLWNVYGKWGKKHKSVGLRRHQISMLYSNFKAIYSCQYQTWIILRNIHTLAEYDVRFDWKKSNVNSYTFIRQIRWYYYSFKWQLKLCFITSLIIQFHTSDQMNNVVTGILQQKLGIIIGCAIGLTCIILCIIFVIRFR